MNQGTQGYSLTKKTKGRKSRDTLPLIPFEKREILTTRATLKCEDRKARAFVKTDIN
jgi:hypothetical protein